MKATELRIGNYVIHNHGTDLFSTVEWIQNDCVSVCFSVQSDFATGCTCSLNKIFPIPITEEWLEKFGFFRYCEKYRLTLSQGLYFNVNRMKDGYSVYRNRARMRKVKYVHEFQNLFFALTGEELTLQQ